MTPRRAEGFGGSQTVSRPSRGSLRPSTGNPAAPHRPAPWPAVRAPAARRRGSAAGPRSTGAARRAGLTIARRSCCRAIHAGGHGRPCPRYPTNAARVSSQRLCGDHVQRCRYRRQRAPATNRAVTSPLSSRVAPSLSRIKKRANYTCTEIRKAHVVTTDPVVEAAKKLHVLGGWPTRAVPPACHFVGLLQP
jgi:hypothetical protein